MHCCPRVYYHNKSEHFLEKSAHNRNTLVQAMEIDISKLISLFQKYIDMYIGTWYMLQN